MSNPLPFSASLPLLSTIENLNSSNIQSERNSKLAVYGNTAELLDDMKLVSNDIQLSGSYFLYDYKKLYPLTVK